jgi:hypothetical protein
MYFQLSWGSGVGRTDRFLHCSHPFFVKFLHFGLLVMFNQGSFHSRYPFAISRSRQLSTLKRFICSTLIVGAIFDMPPVHATPPNGPTSDRIVRYAADRQSLELKHKEPLSEFRNSRMLEFLRTQMLDLDAIDPKHSAGPMRSTISF